MSTVPLLSLSDAIAAAELSRVEVAAAVGVRPERIWTWESTKRRDIPRSPSASQIEALSRVLRLSPPQQARLVSWLSARQLGELTPAEAS